MYETVLLPTDGSEAAAAAIDHAIAIADQFGAELHVISVLEKGPYGNPKRDRIRADLEGEAEAAVSAVRDRAGDLEVTETIEAGVPHESILETAGTVDADLIVMATHGRSGLDRYLIGSVAERVVRNAAIPVVTVRSQSGS